MKKKKEKCNPYKILCIDTHLTVNQLLTKLCNLLYMIITCYLGKKELNVFLYISFTLRFSALVLYGSTQPTRLIKTHGSKCKHNIPFIKTASAKLAHCLKVQDLRIMSRSNTLLRTRDVNAL